VPDHDSRGRPRHAVGERVRDEDHARPSARNIGQVSRVRKKGKVVRTGAVEGGDARELRVLAPLHPAGEQRRDLGCPHGSVSPRRDRPPVTYFCWLPDVAAVCLSRLRTSFVMSSVVSAATRAPAAASKIIAYPPSFWSCVRT